MTIPFIINLSNDQKYISDYILNLVPYATDSRYCNEVVMTKEEFETKYQNDVKNVIADMLKNTGYSLDYYTNRFMDSVLIYSEDPVQDVVSINDLPVYQYHEKIGHDHPNINMLQIDGQQNLRPIVTSPTEFNKLQIKKLDHSTLITPPKGQIFDFLEDNRKLLFGNKTISRTDEEEIESLRQVVMVELNDEAFFTFPKRVDRVSIYVKNDKIKPEHVLHPAHGVEMHNCRLSFLNIEKTLVNNYYNGYYSEGFPYHQGIHLNGNSSSNILDANVNSYYYSTIALSENANNNIILGAQETNSQFILSGSASNNTIYGQNSTDDKDQYIFRENTHSNFVSCVGTGSDWVFLLDNSSTNYIDTGNGDDAIIVYSSGSDNEIHAGPGDDDIRVMADANENIFYGGDGNDMFAAGGLANKYFGGNGDDVFFAFRLYKSEQDHFKEIYGGAGQDIIFPGLTGDVAGYMRLKFEHNYCEGLPKMLLKVTLGKGNDAFFFRNDQYIDSQTFITDYNPQEDIFYFDNEQLADKVMSSIKDSYKNGLSNTSIEHNGHIYNIQFPNSIHQQTTSTLKYGIYQMDTVHKIFTDNDYSLVQMKKMDM